MDLRISHIAIWTKNLEMMKDFYVTYFAGIASDKYVNKIKNFASYFIQFQSGAKLELMWQPEKCNMRQLNSIGYAHIAISLGSKENVNHYTEIFRSNDLLILSEPRVTGDGYYESVVSDPEGNLIELTI